MRNMLLIGVIEMIVASAAGCSTVDRAAGAAGSGIFAMGGGAKMSFSAPADKVYNTALEVLKEGGITVSDSACDATGGYINGFLASGDDVNIEIVAGGANLTSVSVKAGSFGDSSRSQYILSRIDARLNPAK